MPFVLFLFVLSFFPSAHAGEDPAYDAGAYVWEQLGLDFSARCTDGKKSWSQWQFEYVPRDTRFRTGFTSALTPPILRNGYMLILEADRLQVNVLPGSLTDADTWNGIEWYGTIEVTAGIHRELTGANTSAPQLEQWNNKNPIFMLQAKRQNGAWTHIGLPQLRAARTNSCIKVENVVAAGRNEHDRQTRELLDEQRLRQEEFERSHPVTPHKTDPYFSPPPR